MESHVWFRDNYLVVTFHLTMCLSHSRTFSNHYACLYIVLSYQIKLVQSVSAGTREPRYDWLAMEHTYITITITLNITLQLDCPVCSVGRKYALHMRETVVLFTSSLCT